MIRKKKGNLEWLEFHLLQEKRVRHGVFLSLGGYSEGPFSRLNLGASVGDDPVLVQKNRGLVKDLFSSEQLIMGKQVHGENIEEVKEHLFFEMGCDGLITQKKKKALTILHADCQAAIFYDPISHKVANIHCGWRGNVLNIYQKTIDRLKRSGSNPSDLLVCISPSLGPTRAEFIHFSEEFPESFQEFMHQDCLFNLWEISRKQLIKGGVLSDHIEIAQICTYENGNNFFSYRRDKVTGRNGTVVELL